MDILFLDIDGVLNSYQSAFYLQKIRKENPIIPEHLEHYLLPDGDMCPIAISNLEILLTKVKTLKIVVSSTWRLGCNLKELKKYFKMSKLIQERLIDSTPSLRNSERGDEIRRWLLVHSRVKRFVAIDDDRDMTAIKDNFVYIDNKVGFDYRKLEEVLEFFKE